MLEVATFFKYHFIIYSLYFFRSKNKTINKRNQRGNYQGRQRKSSGCSVTPQDNSIGSKPIASNISSVIGIKDNKIWVPLFACTSKNDNSCKHFIIHNQSSCKHGGSLILLMLFALMKTGYEIRVAIIIWLQTSTI